jgi:hypothetical protein
LLAGVEIITDEVIDKINSAMGFSGELPLWYKTAFEFRVPLEIASAPLLFSLLKHVATGDGPQFWSYQVFQWVMVAPICHVSF